MVKKNLTPNDKASGKFNQEKINNLRESEIRIMLHTAARLYLSRRLVQSANIRAVFLYKAKNVEDAGVKSLYSIDATCYNRN